MTPNLNGTESGILLSRLCVIAGVIGGVLAVLHPFLGAALSVLVLMWAIAGQRGTGQHAYRTALLVSLAALVMNTAILLASLSVGTSVPDPLPAVKIS
jgi:hypothetical protein